ncbi:hypothetical protein [Nocardia sp. NPDC005825]|uniref:hypothetical protein n=1 Tax=unclassified Nocardia TaxID=2637762 RepID=UPI003406398E
MNVPATGTGPGIATGRSWAAAIVADAAAAVGRGGSTADRFDATPSLCDTAR